VANEQWQVREKQHMKDHYDFTNGIRGKFYKADATFHHPVYLDQKVESRLVAKAEAQGIELSELVNELLRKELASDTD
jgi:hypothetical protein